MPSLRSFENTYFPFLFLVFFAFGFLGGIYYVEHASQFSRTHYSTAEILRSRDLTHRLHRVEYRNAHLESQMAELNLKLSDLYKNSAYTRMQRLATFNGLIQQEGPGVEIILKDSAKPLLLGDNPNTGIVHNTDLLQVVNDLRAAGAKAVAINNQPVLNTTGIHCSGPIILLNNSRITSPFVIHALGDPEQMVTEMQQPASFLKELNKYGIEVMVTAKKDVVIPAYSSDMFL